MWSIRCGRVKTVSNSKYCWNIGSCIFVQPVLTYNVESSQYVALMIFKTVSCNLEIFRRLTYKILFIWVFFNLPSITYKIYESHKVANFKVFVYRDVLKINMESVSKCKRNMTRICRIVRLTKQTQQMKAYVAWFLSLSTVKEESHFDCISQRRYYDYICECVHIIYDDWSFLDNIWV